jgi:hypothetical protein
MRFPGIIRAVTAARDRRGHIEVDGLIHNVGRLQAGGVLRFAAIVATGASASLTLTQAELARARRGWRAVVWASASCRSTLLPGSVPAAS